MSDAILQTDGREALLDGDRTLLATIDPVTDDVSRSILPSNATPLLLALSEAFAFRAAALPAAIGVFDAIDPARCDAQLLEHLAWEWSVDDWDPEWDEATQRAAIRASWGVHSVKGSADALARALAVPGLQVEMLEWFETGRPPYTFRARVSDPLLRPFGARERGRVEQVGVRVKNVRSFLEGIDVMQPGVKAPVFVGAVLQSRVRVHIEAPAHG